MNDGFTWYPAAPLNCTLAAAILSLAAVTLFSIAAIIGDCSETIAPISRMIWLISMTSV